MKVELKDLSYSDLYSLYLFVASKASMHFGGRKEARQLVQTRLAEVEQELYLRSFGSNPYIEAQV